MARSTPNKSNVICFWSFDYPSSRVIIALFGMSVNIEKPDVIPNEEILFYIFIAVRAAFVTYRLCRRLCQLFAANGRVDAKR